MCNKYVLSVNFYMTISNPKGHEERSGVNNQPLPEPKIR